MTKTLPRRSDKSLLLFVLATACFLLSIVPANAATYYVAPDGDDSNPGTIDQPWKTIDTAVDELGAGDTLYFRAGTYTTAHWFDVESYAAGTADEPIILTAYPGEEVILDYSSLASGDPIWLKGQHVVFSGFEVTGSPHYGITVTGKYVTIANCVLHDNANDAVKILSSAGHVTVTGCTFFNSTHNCIDCFGSYTDIHHNYFIENANAMVMKGGSHGNIVHHNIFSQASPLGGHVDWPSCLISVGGWSTLSYKKGEWECEDTLVYNNLIINNAAGGIYFWEARNCAAYNNTIYNAEGQYGISVFGNGDDGSGQRHPSVNVTIKNNIIITVGDRARGTLYVAGGSEVGFICDNNLYWREDEVQKFVYGATIKTDGRVTVDLADFRAHFGTDANSLWADPQFIDAVNNDFHLSPDSPVIDAGVYELGVPSDDFDGNPRPYGDAIDIGAYEYIGAGGADQAPLLAWAGETGYESDGLEPEIGTAGTDFTWKIEYSDPDGDAPDGVYLHILDDGTELADSPYQMTSQGGTDWSAGVVFAKTLTLPKGAAYTYYFSAADEPGAQTSYPDTPVSAPQVNNSPPTTPTVTISLESPTDQEELQASAEGSTDIDESDDVSYQYQWYCDDVLQDDLTDATVPASRTLGGEVWRCEVVATDGQDDSEPGTAQVTIIATYSISGTILDSDSNPVADVTVTAGDNSVTTDDSGEYTISALLAGTYEVTPSKTGWVFSPESQNATVDADTGSQTGVDFTAYPPPPPPQAYSISGTVLDSAGQPLPAVTVSTGDFSATTDSEGTYSITELAEGTYTVIASKDEYTFDPENQSVTVGPDEDGIDFTGTVITYAISGTVRDSADQPLADVTVAAGEQSATTDSEGQYAITGLVAGTYTVTPSRGEYTFDPENRSVTVGPDKSGVDFTATVVTYSISGTVTDSADQPLSGVTISAGDRSASTDSQGQYSITGLVADTYTVTPSRDECAFDPENRSVTVGPDKSGIDFTGTVITYSISGTILDSQGQPISGVCVSDGTYDTAIDDDGTYVISGLVAGTYTIEPIKEEYTFTPESQSVTVGPDQTHIDFTGTPITYSISGSVTNAIGSPLEGVTVSAGGQSGTTDADGTYTITGVVAGTYTVTPTKDEYTFTALGQSQVTVGPDQSGIDFAALQEKQASPSLPAKWNLISIPLQPVASSTNTVLEELWPLVWQWHNSADDPPARYIAKPQNIEMGRSVFAYCEQAGDAVDLVGAEPTSEVAVQLNTGWNFIGAAFPDTVPFSSLELESAGTRVSLIEAVGNDWIWPIIFTWNSDQQEYEAWLMDGGGLEPWSGGVVYCEQPCTLIQPPPSASPDQLAGQVQPSRVGNKEDVLFQIRVETPESSDLATAALAEGASVAFDGVLLDVPKAPPPPGGRVRVWFVNQDNTANPGPSQWQRETRSPSELTSDTPWRVQVVAPGSQEVVLSWPDLSRLPKDVRPMLHDLATGRSIYMRTQLRYKFTREGSTTIPRVFEIQCDSRQSQALTVTSLSAAVQPGGAALTFALSTDASVDAEVLNISGRCVADLAYEKVLPAGMHTLRWDMHNDHGAPVPNGLYLIRVRARQPNGQQVQALTTCNISRR